MREEYDNRHDGLGRTGRLVTSAALILFLAFVSMASGPQAAVKILATGLPASILLDATVTRALLARGSVLHGSLDWWMPTGLDGLRMPPRRGPARGLQPVTGLDSRPRAGSSVGQSSGLIIRRSLVRVQPGPSHC